MRMASELVKRETDVDDFIGQAQGFVRERPAVTQLAWLDDNRKRKAGRWATLYREESSPGNDAADPSLPNAEMQNPPELAFAQARDMRQPVYSRAFVDSMGVRGVPDARAAGRRATPSPAALMVEYSVEALLRHFVPPEVANRHTHRAWSTSSERVLASTVTPMPGPAASQRTPIVYDAAAGADRQRPAAARPGLPHLDRPDQQHAVLDGGGAVGADGVDAAGQLAPHAPARADPGARWCRRPTSAARWRTRCSPACARWTWKAASPTSTPAFCAMTGFSEADAGRPRARPSPTGRSDRIDENSRLLQQELQRPQPGRRHRGAGDAQGRLAVRRAHVRLAADRPARPADRLDDLDDQHHRGQAHPRPAVGLARALHHRARRPGRLGVGAVGAAGRIAVRQPLVPAVVRRRCRRPCAAHRQPGQHGLRRRRRGR